MKKALILNYHLIDGEIYRFDAFGEIYAVTQKNFVQQMSILKESNIKVASLNDIVDNRVKEEFCVALTFDDGNPSDFDLVFPLLKQLGYTATFFLSIHNLERNGVLWDQYRQMISHGFGIGSHGMTHRDLTIINPSEVEMELLQSKQTIESKVNYSIRFFSLPFGMYNSKVSKQAQDAGYEAIFTTRFNLVCPSEKPFVIDRWSVKRNASMKDFKQIVQNHRFTVSKYTYVSVIKKGILSGIGSSIINKLYTFINKLF